MWKASIDPTLMMRDGASALAAAASIGTSSLMRKKQPLTLSSNTLSQPDSGYSAKGAAHKAPALLIRTSREDSWVFSCATSFCLSSLDAILHGRATHVPNWPSSSAVALHFSSSRE